MGGKRLSKKRRQHLQELHASPKAGFKCCPNGLKAQKNKTQKALEEAMQLRAVIERLHQQLSDAEAHLQQVRTDTEQLQAAHQELLGENEALEQLAEDRTQAIQLLQRDKRRLSLALRNEEAAQEEGKEEEACTAHRGRTRTGRKRGQAAQPAGREVEYRVRWFHRLEDTFLGTLNCLKQGLSLVPLPQVPGHDPRRVYLALDSPPDGGGVVRRVRVCYVAPGAAPPGPELCDYWFDQTYCRRFNTFRTWWSPLRSWAWGRHPPALAQAWRAPGRSLSLPGPPTPPAVEVPAARPAAAGTAAPSDRARLSGADADVSGEWPGLSMRCHWAVDNNADAMTTYLVNNPGVRDDAGGVPGLPAALGATGGAGGAPPAAAGTRKAAGAAEGSSSSS
ncbi:hypothetical protein V8C86DRAFT_3142375, partial [Haematococcus lacustris]